MGIYDRDYYRQSRPGFSLTAPRSAVVILVLINVAVFLAEVFVDRDLQNKLFDLLAVHAGNNPAFGIADTLTSFHWWQLLTYGFLHDPRTAAHILFNLLTLWFLGRDIEDLYGAKEFVRIYLVAIVVAGLVWSVTTRLAHDMGSAIGASGAISAVVTLYALNFPRRMLLVMFVLPMPAWAVGVLAVALDIMGQMGHPVRDPFFQGNVAFAAHLGGAAFAFVYWQQGWNFGRLFQGGFHWPKLRSRPKLRLHDPDDPEENVPEQEVDRILEKIHREGEASLTRKERRILENASREYQRRRRPGG